MTKGKKDSGERIHATDAPVSERDLSRYLHREYGFAPPSRDAMDELLADIIYGIEQAMLPHERPRAGDVIRAEARQRVGYDANGEPKPGSVASNVTTRARSIYFHPCPVTWPPFEWAHVKKPAAGDTLWRTFLWSPRVFQPTPRLTARTELASWMHKASKATATFVKAHVTAARVTEGYSVPMDTFSALLGRATVKRRRRCIWPEGNAMETGLLEAAPKDRPSLRQDLVQDLATFFLDEPLFQLWDRKVWVIVAPQRAVVIASRSAPSHTPKWTLYSPPSSTR